MRSYAVSSVEGRPLISIALPLSWDTSVPFISTHLKCSVCGSHKINTKPELHSGGVAAIRGRRATRNRAKAARASAKFAADVRFLAQSRRSQRHA